MGKIICFWFRLEPDQRISLGSLRPGKNQRQKKEVEDCVSKIYYCILDLSEKIVVGGLVAVRSKRKRCIFGSLATLAGHNKKEQSRGANQRNTADEIAALVSTEVIAGWIVADSSGGYAICILCWA